MAEARERTKEPLIIAPSVTGTRSADLVDWRQAVFIGRSCEDSEHDFVARNIDGCRIAVHDGANLQMAVRVLLKHVKG